MKKASERLAVFHAEFREDLRHWVKTDSKDRVTSSRPRGCDSVDPFKAIGKPEPLRFRLAGCWSPRITQEHRMVYQVTDQQVDFLQCRYRY
ncbi:MAG: Txe/YoeB family addiction module toxin [Bryobacteraceae bacterium]|nr:Txe/YoeB family addiction module toxin [Bryobacteraceae bacterium]